MTKGQFIKMILEESPVIEQDSTIQEFNKFIELVNKAERNGLLEKIEAITFEVAWIAKLKVKDLGKIVLIVNSRIDLKNWSLQIKAFLEDANLEIN